MFAKVITSGHDPNKEPGGKSLALYLKIVQQSVEGEQAVYEYSPDGKLKGTLRIDVKSGEVESVGYAPSEPEKRWFFAAATKLRKHWRSGSLPLETEWAS